MHYFSNKSHKLRSAADPLAINETYILYIEPHPCQKKKRSRATLHLAVFWPRQLVANQCKQNYHTSKVESQR